MAMCRNRSSVCAKQPRSPAGNPWHAIASEGRPLTRQRIGERIRGVGPGPQIVWGLLLSLVLVVANRVAGLWRAPGKRAQSRQDLRQKLIERWTGFLGERKGAFAKAGQFASLRLDVIPSDLATSLARLRDQVPPLPFPEIRHVIESDLGGPMESHFPNIDAIPLGAASIAQAHRARLPDGSDVIVKVQYPWVRSSIRSDLRWLRLLASLALRSRGRKSKTLDVSRFFDEFESSLQEEMDFRIEARAAAEIARNLKDDPQVRVPRVVETHSSERVLTVYYHPCVNVIDRSGLARLGVSPRAILEILARAYSKQIFVDGLFHADPHSGNLFVIDEPGAAEKPCVLFVDFGLHRRLSKELRTSLRKGIYALLQKDLDEFIHRMDELDIIAEGAQPAVRTAVEEMFRAIGQSSGAGSPLAVGGGRILDLKDQAKRLLEQTPGLQLPNDLLLYARTLSYLFALGEELDPEVDLMKISTPYLLRFLAEKD